MCIVVTHTYTHTMHVRANYCLIHWCIVEHSMYLQGEKPESIHNEAMHNKKRRKVSNRERERVPQDMNILNISPSIWPLSLHNYECLYWNLPTLTKTAPLNAECTYWYTPEISNTSLFLSSNQERECLPSGGEGLYCTCTCSSSSPVLGTVCSLTEVVSGFLFLRGI